MTLINLPFEYWTVNACCVCLLRLPAAVKLKSMHWKEVNGGSPSEVSEKTKEI